MLKIIAYRFFLLYKKLEQLNLKATFNCYALFRDLKVLLSDNIFISTYFKFIQTQMREKYQELILSMITLE